MNARRRTRAGIVIAALLGGLLPMLTMPATADPAPGPYVPVSGIPCYDGDGPRVHVFYLYAAGQPDDLPARLATIRDAAAQADAVFAASASKTGGIRHIRFATGASCSLVVTSVAVDKADPKANLTQLVDSGLLAKGDDALAFVGPTLGAYGGDATFPEDDRAGSGNVSNAGGQLAALGFAFWGDIEAASLVLARAFGAVQRTAPHASGAGHCIDDTDPLCFDDLTIGEPMTTVCPADNRYVLDCGDNDYFSTAPAAGSWLAAHWNIADSVFLAREAPPAVDAVTEVSVTLEGVPADGRVGPQTQLTVKVTDDQPLTQVVLVSDRSPGVQPLTISGSTATGSLRGLTSVGPGTLFALVTDKLGRQRRTPTRVVSYVGGARLSTGSVGSSLRGAAPYTVTTDLSGDQSAATRFVVFAPKTADREAVILVDRQLVPGTTSYTGEVDTTKLADADDQQLILVLADAAGNPVAGSQSAIKVSITNTRPALAFEVPDTALTGPTPLQAVPAGAVASVSYLHTRTDCASGRVLGTSTTAPYAVSYDPAVDYSGPQLASLLCARAATADGGTVTVGPLPIAIAEPDRIELRVASGSGLSVGRNRLPIVLTVPSHRQVRLLQLLETTTVFGKGGHFVASVPVEAGTLPSTLDVDVPPGATGSTELYVRAVFADSEGEFLRSNAVPVTAVPGARPTLTVSPPSIVAGEKVLLKGTGAPGAQLRIYALSRPASTYRLIRSGAVPLDGAYGAVVAPTTSSRFYVEVLGGGTSANVPVNVRAVVTLTPTRIGRLTYRFSGSVFPKRAGVRVTVGARTARGGVALARATTTADGRWSVTYRFPSAGTAEVFAVTTADAVNTAGSSALRRLLVG